jgi:hypothetical protein
VLGKRRVGRPRRFRDPLSQKSLASRSFIVQNGPAWSRAMPHASTLNWVKIGRCSRLRESCNAQQQPSIPSPTAPPPPSATPRAARASHRSTIPASRQFLALFLQRRPHRSAITAGSSSMANATVSSNPCGPMMRTRNPPLNGSAAIHASCGSVALPAAGDNGSFDALPAVGGDTSEREDRERHRP